jgi:hypothetical protein
LPRQHHLTAAILPPVWFYAVSGKWCYCPSLNLKILDRKYPMTAKPSLGANRKIV